MRPACHTRPLNARGFTLVEVLVALIIVAFGMSAVLVTLTSAGDNTVALRERALAEWAALNQLTTTRVSSTAPSDGTTEGDIDNFGNGRWHWQQTVEDLEITGVQRITVQVRRLKNDESAADKEKWLATVVGFHGSNVANASGELPNWTGSAFGGTGGNGRMRSPGAPGAGQGGSTPPGSTPGDGL